MGAMMLGYEQTHIDVDPRFLATRFDREPFGFTHSLCDLDLLKISELQRLAARYTEHDYFVAAGATTAAMPFYSVRHSDCTPVQAIERLAAGGQRILLKRPEKYDVRFRDLLATSFAQIIERRNGLDGKIVRLDSSILISSAATITPFHYDPEISFFCQIAGDKFYHIYSPCALDERELERFYVAGIVNIAQVPLAGRDPALEHVFALRPGMGMHQPRNAPHWVQTSDTLSISYVISFETDRTRAIGRTRAFNHYARAVGLTPKRPQARPASDAFKAKTMEFAIPARKAVGAALRRITQK
jgi:hypothetical protein